MNNQRRKTITDLVKQIEAMKDKIEDEFKEASEQIAGEEQDAFDNLPEGLQESEKGQRMEEAVDAINEADQGFDEAISGLDEAIEALTRGGE